MRSPWKKIAEGKTKIIYALENCDCVVKIESKDVITADDGEKRDDIAQKGILANNTTCNIFSFLERQGIRTHFIERLSKRAFLAYWCDMIPLEVVVRRWATGSYLKRNPQVKEGKRLDPPATEFFFKKDSLHDPYVVVEDPDSWSLYQPKQPINSKGLIKTIDSLCNPKEAQYIQKQAQKIFEYLESAWETLEVRLWDMKVEFGRDRQGSIRLADVVDNGSWRITRQGKQLDKQLYRDGRNLEIVHKAYQLVSSLTGQFKEIDL